MTSQLSPFTQDTQSSQRDIAYDSWCVKFLEQVRRADEHDHGESSSTASNTPTTKYAAHIASLFDWLLENDRYVCRKFSRVWVQPFHVGTTV